tara:strand:+ start:338164 stop:338727 length:564 start_codon:yes stop_codon:yes gene_type:complete
VTEDLLQSPLPFTSGNLFLKKIGYFWGIIGVLALLLSAITRLSMRVIEMLDYPMTLLHWLALFGFTLYMAYAEGYKGFHQNFAPRVIERARIFSGQQGIGSPGFIIFAPLLCMGYIHATRKRKITTFSLSAMIIVLIVLVSMMPQPWRGVIDAGVVFGLLIGVLSILYFWFRSQNEDWRSPVSADFP